MTNNEMEWTEEEDIEYALGWPTPGSLWVVTTSLWRGEYMFDYDLIQDSRIMIVEVCKQLFQSNDDSIRDIQYLGIDGVVHYLSDINIYEWQNHFKEVDNDI